MPEWVRELFNIGITGMVTAGVGWIIWWKMIPWGERYITSTELLHQQIASTMAKQQDLCDEHGEIITGVKRHIGRHDAVVRTACAMCRDMGAKHYPAASELINRHCAEIERIIGEA